MGNSCPLSCPLLHWAAHVQHMGCPWAAHFSFSYGYTYFFGVKWRPLSAILVIFLCDCYVLLTSSDLLTSAPFCNNSLTTSSWPAEDAAWRGVHEPYKKKTNHPISSNSHPSATTNKEKHSLKRGGLQKPTRTS